MQDTTAARALFPRGLFQPEGSFRFSLDALLLASFAGRLSDSGSPRLLDLGCGCGPVGLAFLLDNPQAVALGLDFQPELARAADLNAARLGLEKSYAAHCVNLEEIRETGQLRAYFQHGEEFDLITANPPYRLPGSGREPAGESRRLALFGSRKNLTAFVRVAAMSLRPGGAFCVVFPWPRLEELRRVLEAQGLEAFHQIEVSSRPKQNPFLVMLAARRAAEVDVAHVNPDGNGTLTLYRERGGLSRQTLEFCPHLACNSRN